MSNQNRKHYSKDFKLEAVKLVISEGYKLSEAAARLGVGKSTLSKWRRDYQRGLPLSDIFLGKGNISPPLAQVKALEKELSRVKQERDILKKAMAYFAVPQK